MEVTGAVKYVQRFQLWSVAAICVGLVAVPTGALADCNVQPGTVVTKANWQQYKDCFSEGVQKFWEGGGFWKMPDDAQIHVGKPHNWMLPKPYVDATEKYGGQTRLAMKPNEEIKLNTYVAGGPTPHTSSRR